MRICYVGNFDTNSVGEPEIAKCLEAGGHEVVRLKEQSISIAEVEKECQASDFLLFAKFRVGTPNERQALLERLTIPAVCWVFDLYVSL